MDCGKAYIKMCTAAVEIQESRPLRDPLSFGDVFCCPTHGVIILGMMAVGLCCGTLERPTKKVWLPRQDQLQKMVSADWGDDIGGFAFAFHVFIHEDRKRKLSHVGYTWEQLWLAYVMYERYQKCWTSEEWQKE